MVLDTATLRIAFALMAMVLGLLFYFSAYRFTRSPYSGWWCLALVFFLTGSAAFLFNGTGHQCERDSERRCIQDHFAKFPRLPK